MNLTERIAVVAREYPARIAVVTPEASVSYEALMRQVQKASVFFKSDGVRAGDAIVLELTDELLLLYCMLGIARLGATVFTVSGSVTMEEAAGQLDIAMAYSDRKDMDGDGTVRRLDRMRLTTQLEGDAYASAPGAPWQIMAGSGTTGTRKWIAVSHACQLAKMRAGLRWLEARPGDVVASLVHLAYNVTKNFYLEALDAGACIALTDKQNPDPAAALDALRIDVLHATVYHVQFLLQQSRREPVHQLQGLKNLVVGGSAVSMQLRHEAAKHLTPNLCIRYGAIEVGTIAVAAPAIALQQQNSVGSAVEHAHIEVVDAEDQAVPRGDVGMLRIRTPGIFSGYLGNDDATNARLRDGWFYPGDLGKFDAAGVLIHLGRADDMIMFNGMNIYPSEIEAVLRGHPGVLDAAVTAKASPQYGQIPVAAVAADPGIDEKELLAYCRKALGLRMPRRIVMLPTLPRNAQGKIAAASLRALFETGGVT